MSEYQVRHLEQTAAQLNQQALQLELAKPNRCSTRLQDFVMTALYEWQFSEAPTRWNLMRQCYAASRSGAEPPREPHLNVPPTELPRWDPWHPQYDPGAPYDSFERLETHKRNAAKIRKQAEIIGQWATNGSKLWQHPDEVALQELRRARDAQTQFKE